ncbi:sigma-70 family RNA polymerase sigma factor [Planctomicrobium sp. SH661]|uniref:sigma-70 family RNA polymerase sigma factor n=1 Tax=Planctomicrobium sp. SH661 TaxID=3448124 RepID=UPI003F5BFB06
MFNDFDLENLESDLGDPSREAEFLRRLADARRDILVYVMSIVGNRTDADDVMQEVCALLWQKFDEFDPDRNFRKWAFGFAFNLAKTFVRNQRRRRGYGMSDRALAKIAFVQSAGSELFELRRELLDQCLEKLRAKDQRFLMECYDDRTTLVDYASAQKIPVATVYTRLRRVREQLVACINRSLGREANG